MEKRRETRNVLNPGAIPVEGALGLLALGSTGLRAWRNVRDAAITTEGAATDIASGGDNEQEASIGRSGQGGAT